MKHDIVGESLTLLISNLGLQNMKPSWHWTSSFFSFPSLMLLTNKLTARVMF
jgi:hypothetical protein